MEINKFELRVESKSIDLNDNMSIAFNYENDMYGLYDKYELVTFCEFAVLKDLINYTNIIFKRHDVVIYKEVD